MESPPGARASCPHKGWYSRGYLPHLDAPETVQAITFRLADSLPAEVLDRLKDDPDRRRKVEALLDAGGGSGLLREPAVAMIVDDALLHFDGERYRLLSWVVMPNHVHCLVEVLPGWGMPGIVQSWKSFTANRINQAVGRSGRLWQPEYFDRYIRDDSHLAAAMAYIDNNPVKAGFVPVPEAWPFGSAALRAGCPRSREAGFDAGARPLGARASCPHTESQP